jgi:hypothetical protein
MSECYPSSTVRHPSLEQSSSLDTAFFSSTDTHSFCKVLSCLTHVVHFPAPKKLILFVCLLYTDCWPHLAAKRVVYYL